MQNATSLFELSLIKVLKLIIRLSRTDAILHGCIIKHPIFAQIGDSARNHRKSQAFKYVGVPFYQSGYKNNFLLAFQHLFSSKELLSAALPM